MREAKVHGLPSGAYFVLPREGGADHAMEPTREQLDTMPGPVVLEFGAGWCVICRGARPLIDEALASHGGVPHIRIEDGKGKRLGRSYGVKLWPTLVFLHDGREVGRIVRPNGRGELEIALDRLAARSSKTRT